jgi:hypothetical protein
MIRVMPKRVKRSKRNMAAKGSKHAKFEQPSHDVEASQPILSAAVSEYMAQIGSKGGKIGGKRRLQTMSSEQRSKIAAKAAKARWKAQR